MIKKLIKPEVAENQDEKVIPFQETCTCNNRTDNDSKYISEDEIDDITF